MARKIPQKCEEGGGVLSEERPLSYIMASVSPSLPMSPLGEGWMKAPEFAPQTPVPQPLQDLRGRKLSSQGAEGDLEYVQGIPGSSFPAPPHSVISKDLRTSRPGSSCSVYDVGGLFLLTPLSSGLLREEGMDCGKIEEEEPSPALGGVGLVTFPFLGAAGRI